MGEYKVELEGYVLVTAQSALDAEDLAMDLIHGEIPNVDADIEFDVKNVEEVG